MNIKEPGMSIEMISESGASEHVANDPELFKTMEKIYPIEVYLANKSIVPARHEGTLSVNIQGVELILYIVYFIPELRLNLIFCSRLDYKGLYAARITPLLNNRPKINAINTHYNIKEITNKTSGKKKELTTEWSTQTRK